MKKVLSACIALLLGNAALQAMHVSSPVIKTIEWGKVIVTQDTPRGQFGAVYKDCKLYPGESHEWNWLTTGTLHDPGIQPADLEDFIDKVEIVILSKGMENKLQTKPETIELLEQKKKEYHILETSKAVELYNKLVEEGKLVGALIHSTC